MTKKTVGIITWHYFNNFGSALQAYAVQRLIQSKGYACRFINFRDPKYGRPNKLKEWIKYALARNPIFPKYKFPFICFQHKYLKQTKLVYEPEKLSAISRKFDVVVCGSDQIWAPNVFNPVYMLNFVPDSITKMSYAASVGLNDIPNELIDEYKSLLSRFQAVSLREKQGADLLKEKCEIKSEVVLDPTFLIDVEHWATLEKKFPIESEYIFCYFLNKNHKYKNAVRKYAKKIGARLVGYSLNAEDKEWMVLLNGEIGPREFLWLIRNAETVLTDSYHGTIFSLLYHKDFVTFERFENTDVICQNSRVFQLREYFELSQRIIRVDDGSQIEVHPINYDNFETRLSELRKKSKDYLYNALEM